MYNCTKKLFKYDKKGVYVFLYETCEFNKIKSLRLHQTIYINYFGWNRIISFIKFSVKKRRKIQKKSLIVILKCTRDILRNLKVKLVCNVLYLRFSTVNINKKTNSEHR